MEIIMCVVNQSTSDEMRTLLERGTLDVNYRDVCWRTALHHCHLYSVGCSQSQVRCGIDVINLLIQHGADVNAIDVINRQTPLLYYMFNGCHPDYITTLLSNNANPNIEDGHGNVPLFYYLCNYVCSNDINTDIFKKLIPTRRINRRNCGGDTPLIATVRKGCKKECVHALFVAGAKVHVRSRKSKNQTILHDFLDGYKTIDDNSLAVLTMLIKNGADVNHVDRDDFTPLLLFLNRGIKCARHFKILLYNGANVHAVDRQGNRVLHHRLMSCSIELCNLFLDFGADPNVKNRFGETPITIAAGFCLIRDGDFITTLCNYGAHIDIKCLMFTSDPDTGEVVPLSWYEAVHYYVKSNSYIIEARYETIFKHIFLKYPHYVNFVLSYEGSEFFKMKNFTSIVYDEFEQMKLYRLPSGPTLFDFVTETEQKKYILYVLNSINIDWNLLSSRYPLYATIILSKIKITRKWKCTRDMLKRITISSKSNKKDGNKVHLNALCIHHLAQFLGLHDMQKIIIVSVTSESELV